MRAQSERHLRAVALGVAACLVAFVALAVASPAGRAAAADPSPAASSTPAAVASDPIDLIAAALAEGDPALPPEKDSALGGAAATIVLLLCAMAAALVTGRSLGRGRARVVEAGTSPGSAEGAVGIADGGEPRGGEASAATAEAPAEDEEPVEPTKATRSAVMWISQALLRAAPPRTAPQVGGLTTAAGSGLPLPKGELIASGVAIARSMKRLTDEPQAELKPGEVIQLLGDAASIGALATILAPGTGLVSLAGSGAATMAEAASPAEVLEQLRRNFGQLAYMQGVLDENVCARDGLLSFLDGPANLPKEAPPPLPADPTALSDDDLGRLRLVWAGRSDVVFDALIAAQREMSELDDHRRNLAHQVDAVNDLLARLDDKGKTPVPPHLGDALLYGLGWYRAADAERMAAALRDSGATATGAAGSGSAAAADAPASASKPASAVHPAPSGKKQKPSKSGKSELSSLSSGMAGLQEEKRKSRPFGDWAKSNGFPGGRMGVLQALAGLERWAGFYDSLTGTLQKQIATLRTQADTAGATRRSLSAEMQHRTLERVR